jgi:hypothetical protein
MTDVVSGFASLFEGRLDVLGAETGMCVRVMHPTYSSYLDAIELHLFGDTPIGTYPMRETTDSAGTEWFVKWGCVDFDLGYEVSIVHAMNLELILGTFGIKAWVEISRSKGVHCWVFASEWVPAAKMRFGLLGACQTVAAPTTEINPKNHILGDGKVGNYVRLPYPRGWEQTHRRVMVDTTRNDTIPLDTFVDVALEFRTNLAEIEALQELYEPPPKPKPPKVKYVHEPSRTYGIRGLSRHILVNGPKEGGDRSSALYALAQSLHRDGLTFDDALKVVYEADASWGKHIERGDPEYLDRMCQKVWGL